MFKMVNALPNTVPHTKVFLIMRQYSFKSDGAAEVTPTPNAGWKSVVQSLFVVLESFIRYLRQEAVDTALADALASQAIKRKGGIIVTQTKIACVTINAFEEAAVLKKSSCTVQSTKSPVESICRQTVVS